MPVVRGDGTLRGGAAVFFRKRARRILPPYYVAMCVALLAQHVPLSSAQTLWRPVTSFGVLTHVLLVHNLWPATFEQINPVFWSVAVESQIYLLFPILVLLWGRFGGALTTLGSIAIGYAAMYAVRGSVIDGLTPHYLGLFGLGMFGSAVAFSQAAPWQAARERVPWARAASALGLVMLAVCAGIPDLPLRTLDFPIGLCAMTILVAALRPEGHRLRTCLSWKPLAGIGRFAYSLYLMHLPVLWLVARSGLLPAGLSAEGRLVRMLVVGPPIALIGSYCFYLLVEQPAMAKRSRAAPVRA
jgi:peptidoglycan/LPS O-acetylase OafA/YrhL